MIGISETLVATSGAGIFFVLFSGQPLVIVGATGPLLLFDESLYKVTFHKKLSGVYDTETSFQLILGQPLVIIGIAAHRSFNKHYSYLAY